jgi:hypothetical protein
MFVNLKQFSQRQVIHIEVEHISKNDIPIAASRLINGPTKQIIGRNGKELKVICNANVTIAYCSITHPNGTEFTPYYLKDGEVDVPYW